MKNRRLHLIAYDISNSRTRIQALKLCRQYATGGQKSLHECWVSAGEHGSLIANLELIIDIETDKVTSVALDGRQSITTLGRGTQPLDPRFLIIS
jgi:CRISPR-associated protein Cas2